MAIFLTMTLHDRILLLLAPTCFGVVIGFISNLRSRSTSTKIHTENIGHEQDDHADTFRIGPNVEQIRCYASYNYHRFTGPRYHHLSIVLIDGI